MATSTSSTTANYGLSQYGASDTVKFLTNYNSDMAAIDAAIKAAKDQANVAVPQTRQIAGKPLSADIVLADLIAAGLAAGTNGQANDSAKLGGFEAANFPQMSSGIWTPTLKGVTAAGTPTYSAQFGLWRKVGKWCFVNFTIGISSKGGLTGSLRIDGLPFVPSDNSAIAIGFPLNASLPDPFYTFGGYVMALSTTIQLVAYSRSGAGNADDTNITDTFSLNSCSCLYAVQ